MSARPALACLILAACNGASSPANPDAAPGSDDAATPSVRILPNCPPAVTATVMTSDNVLAYSPETTTISPFNIVKFVMSPAHNVAPDPTQSTDPSLQVDYGKTVCLEFDKAGTYHFMCTTHHFTGAIVVQ